MKLVCFVRRGVKLTHEAVKPNIFSDVQLLRVNCFKFACVQVDEARIQIHDPELRKMLSLSTADLRFADYLVKHVTENKEDVFLDGTGWEGGDEWIRAQFGLYVHSLLSSALQQGELQHTFISICVKCFRIPVCIMNEHE